MNSAEYVARASGTYGFTSSPSGSIDGLAWVVDDVFDASAFQDGYNIVNVRCESLADTPTFSDAYKQASDKIKEPIEDLGDTLAKARSDELHDKAQKEIDDAKKEISDGEKKVKDGEKDIKDGEKKVKDGEKEIKDGEEKIEQAKKDLADGEQRVADGEEELASGYSQVADGEKKLKAAQSKYDKETAAARAELDKSKNELDTAQQSYDTAKANLDDLKAQYKKANKEAKTPEQKAAAEAMRQQIEEGEQQIATMKAKLDEGWQKYNAAEDQFNKETASSRKKLDQAEAQLSSARSRVAQGEAELADARQQLENGRYELEEKTKELEQAKTDLEKAKKDLEKGKEDLKKAKSDLKKAKSDLADAEDKLENMVNYDYWPVMPRSYNSGVGEISMFSDVTDNLSISMAALFIIVGLLVSYFAVSRIVFEQITQIGTMKALGFRKFESTTGYLSYAGLAVIIGTIVGGAVAYFIVEGIIGSVLADMFVLGGYPAYFGWELFFAIFALEFALVLGATYLACRKILNKHAVDLLRGPEPPAAKGRFYENWGIWDKLPLLVQTIVNNCMNDKRRVLSTIVGVAGCTALIVTAITLNNNVMKSYYRQYEEVYGFNAIAYAEYEPEGAIDNLESALKQEGATTAQVFKKTVLMEQPNGESGSMSIVVPIDEDAFNQVYHVKPVTGGEADLSAEGAWVSQAYSEHFGAKVGDMVTVIEGDGRKYEIPILGFQEFGLTFNEMVVSKAYYERESTDVAPNAVLVQTGGVAIENLEAAISDIEGFDSIVDDASKQKGDFDTFSSVSQSVVFIYLVLATLMAIVVLLNLNVMFIDEKKRELLVLMINGFSVKDARHYVSYDTIVLTAFGIIAGLVLGCVMGAVTVAAVEPVTGSFVKSVDGWAVLIGIFGSAILSVIMSLIALRRVGKFRLTDIGKY